MRPYIISFIISVLIGLTGLVIFDDTKIAVLFVLSSSVSCSLGMLIMNYMYAKNWIGKLVVRLDSNSDSNGFCELHANTSIDNIIRNKYALLDVEVYKDKVDNDF